MLSLSIPMDDSLICAISSFIQKLPPASLSSLGMEGVPTSMVHHHQAMKALPAASDADASEGHFPAEDQDGGAIVPVQIQHLQSGDAKRHRKSDLRQNQEIEQSESVASMLPYVYALCVLIGLMVGSLDSDDLASFLKLF
jgi:hypothetical protein